MTVHEHYMNPGSFDVPLIHTTPRGLLRKIQPYGHIIITSQYFDTINIFDDALMRKNARYAGVVLEPIFDSTGNSIAGQGLVYWLGDEDTGELIESLLSFSSDPPSTVVPALLPSAIQPGNIVDTGVPNYNGSHQWETPLEALRTYCLATDTHFRVNPDATLDLCSTKRDDVYIVTQPKVIVTRRNSGYDPALVSVPPGRLTTRIKAYDYITRVVAIEGPVGDEQFVGALDRLNNPYYDMHGNPVVRTKKVRRPASAEGSLNTYLKSELDQWIVEDEQEVSTEQYEFHRGNLAVGDMFYIFDPPSGFVDYDNPVDFRGDWIFPKIDRLIEAHWPIAKGMGVYYRPGGSEITTEDWIDLTPYVDWEG